MNAIAQNPYVGPRTFSEKERDRFFGREREARELLSLTISGQLVVFYAQSGAGKSSLVNTCLIPDLKKKGFKVFPVARVGGDAPAGLSVDNIYVFNLIRILAPSETTPESLARLKLTEFFAKQKKDPALSDSSKADSASERQILIVDQFEEIFSTHHDQWQKREDFFKQLEHVMEEYPNLRVMLVMREDYIASLDPYAHLLPEHARTRYYMQRLGFEAAVRAIKEPVKNIRPYEKDVAEQLARDLCSIKVLRPDETLEVQPGQYVEPVQLQVICYNLWVNLPVGKNSITAKDLQDVGDVNQSLGRYYAARVKSVATLQGVDERSIRQWFGRKLISKSGIRNLVLREVNKPSGGLGDEVIQALQSDLVRAEKRGGATWYELTHDRLVEPILEDNNRWFAENSSILQRQAELWQQRNRPDGLLFTGKELLDAEEWVKHNTEELGELENDFLNSCRNLKEKEDRSRERQRNWIIGASVAVAVVMIVLAGMAWKGRNEAIAAGEDAKDAAKAAEAASIEAQEQAHMARGNQLAVQSQVVFDYDNQLSLLLALESLKEAEQGGESRLPLAEDVLRRAIEQVGAGVPLYGHGARVSTVVMSPDGHWLASGSDDYTVRLWDMTAPDPSADPIVLYTESCQALTLVFNRSGDRLAIGCTDATVLLWDITADMTAQDTPADPIVLRGHSDWVYSLAFSSDGAWLASGSGDTTVRLWDMAALDPSASPIVLNGHSGLIRTLAFSPKDDWLASGSDDSTVRLWDMTAQDISASLQVLTGHTDWIRDLAFSTDGHWLASASDDSTVRLWDMTALDPSASPIELSGHYGYVYSLAFSSDGAWLASGSGDTTVRLWDMTAPDPSASPIVLNGHSGLIQTLAFSSDGDWLASASDDSTVRLWDMTAPDPSASPIELSGHSGYVNSLAFSPDGHWLVSAGDDATPRLWDISEQSEILKLEQDISSYEMVTSLPGHTKGINALSFNLDGYLASASDDTTVRLWNFQTGLPTEANNILQSEYGFGPVNTLLYLDYQWIAGTGNNNLLAFGAEDSLYVQSYPLAGHVGEISVLAVNQNLGVFAVPNNTNYSLELWINGVDQNPLILSGHTSAVNSIAFSPDDRWLVSGGDNAAMILWGLEDLDAISKSKKFLREQTGDVYAVVFSPDGHWLASASSDSTVSLWDMSKGVPSKAPLILRGHQGAVRTLAFSPSGRWLASAGEDSNIRLWDMSDLSVEPIVLSGSTGSITAITFSPDGLWLVSGGSDANLQIWGTGMDVLKLRACQIANRNLTWQEWREYFKGIPYEKTCGGFPVHPSVAINLRDEGDLLARSEDIEAAIVKYKEAREIDPSIGLSIDDFFGSSSSDDLGDPETRARGLAAQALIDFGDGLAKDGQIEEAVAKYREALIIDPTVIDDLGDPEIKAKGLATQVLIDSGDSLARGGQIEEAVAKYHEALAIDPSLSADLGDPEIRAKDFAAQALIDLGDSLVQSGYTEEAISTYLEALIIIPDIGGSSLDSEARAKELAAQALIKIGDGYAQSGDVDGAVAKYREALAIYPPVSDNFGDPVTRANNLIAIKEEIYTLINAGEYQKAVSIFEAAQGIVPSIFNEYDADILNYLCWDGSLWGYAQDVKDVCEMAVDLAPDNPDIRDSRGVNRALLGDSAGAIEDFEFAIVGWSTSGYTDYVSEREAWVEALRNGQNPFDDEAILESLK